MTLLSDFLEETTPKFNPTVAHGICTVNCEDALEIIDSFLRFSSMRKTNGYLNYQGIRALTPEEEVAATFKKSSKFPFKIDRNTTYMAEASFTYGLEDEVLRYPIHIPFLEPGNVGVLSDKELLIMPTLADMVISIGERAVFINIVVAMYNFLRLNHTVKENGCPKLATVVTTELYLNAAKKVPDTTKAKATVIHYLLAYYGYTKTMELTLGYVPELGYNVEKKEGKVIVSSTKNVPDGWKGSRESYEPTNICFLVDEDKYNADTLYVLGNVMYVIDNFPDKITISQMDDYVIWRRLIGEITLSGRRSIGHLAKFMNIHFNNLDNLFDIGTISKLDSNEDTRNVTTLIELLVVIFNKFCTWILQGNSRTLYGKKSLESTSFILKGITSAINKVYLDVNKEEMRAEDGQPLELKVVKRAFSKHFKPYTILKLRKEKLFVTSVQDGTDNLYFNRTAHMVYQESDFINVNAGKTNTSTRKKLVASMATIGSILNIPKSDPTPMNKINPTINLDPKTFTVLPTPDVAEIIEFTDNMLSNTRIENILDLSDDGIDRDAIETMYDGYDIYPDVDDDND